MDANSSENMNRRRVSRLIGDVVQQHYDLIEITTSEEYSHRVINPSIITNLLLLELNRIFPDTTPKVIETFKSELSYDGDPADFDKYMEDKVGELDFRLNEEIPKFNDISTFREALACIFTFCRITGYSLSMLDLFSLSEDAETFEDHLNFFLDELLSAQISAIEDLTYVDSGYIFTTEQVDYTQYVLNRIYENTGRTKQLVSASDAFQEDLHRSIESFSNMSFGAEGNICIMCNKGGGIPHPATGEPVCIMCSNSQFVKKMTTPKNEVGMCKTCGDHEESGYCDSCDSCYGICECDDCDCYTCKDAESFEAPTGYNESGPRPFYGNRRKMALDRWGNRRFIRRRKDGTYMKNVDVNRSLAMDRRRKSTTWAPAGFRDQGDGSPSLLIRLLDMFKGVDEVVLMAESDLMCDKHDDYCESCGCAAYNSETDAYIYAYNDGHTDARSQSGYKPITSDREITSFKKIFKQQ